MRTSCGLIHVKWWKEHPTLKYNYRYIHITVTSLPPPQPSAFEEKAIEKVDDLLESYMGIRDTELGEWGRLDLGVSLGEGASRSRGAGSTLSTSVICASILPPTRVQRPPWWSLERTKGTRMS